jgi:hypothetical protein
MELVCNVTVRDLLTKLRRTLTSTDAGTATREAAATLASRTAMSIDSMQVGLRAREHAKGAAPAKLIGSSSRHSPSVTQQRQAELLATGLPAEESGRSKQWPLPPLLSLGY